MSRQYRHAMLAEATHDEAARQHFTSAFKSHLSSPVTLATRDGYERRVKPAFVRTRNRPPRDRHEVRKALSRDPPYPMASSLKRAAQELMFESLGEAVERQLAALMARGGAR